MGNNNNKEVVNNAICILKDKNGNIVGQVTLEQKDKNLCHIVVKVYNIPPGLHGIHIHKSGNLSNGCESLCDHYNPFDMNHGSPTDHNRHVGDLGNIMVDANNQGYLEWYDHLIKLYGPTSVLGRSFVLHGGADDLGRGNNAESLITGNSGKRIACGIIGVM